MKLCTYCGYTNYDKATQCRKCDAPFVNQSATATTPKSHFIGPEKARAIRGNALTAIVLGLLIKVYWGGYGLWPVFDYPLWAQFRHWLEPVLLYGGGIAYLVGWVVNFI